MSAYRPRPYRPNLALLAMFEDDLERGIDPATPSLVVEREPSRDPPTPFVIDPPDWLGEDA